MSDDQNQGASTGASDSAGGQQQTQNQSNDQLGDAGKAALEAERKARRDAERQAKDLQTQLDQIDADRRKADEDAAAKRGEFEALAATREQERDAAKREASSLKAENDALKAAVANVLDAEWKELPPEVRDAYLGGDDDPLAKLAFLPKGKTLAAKLAEKEPPARGNGHDPKAGGASNPELKSLISKQQALG